MKSPAMLAVPLSIIKTGKTFTWLLALFISFPISAQQKEIRLYDGPAPGSESWHWTEGEAMVGNPMNAKVTFNVTSPSLVVYNPDKPNGVAVIVCPGGSYHVLNTEWEGTNIARQLNKKGITVFLFKYRLVRSLTNDPWQEMMAARKNPDSLQKKMAPLRTMAITDLNRAIRYVRDHSPEMGIDSNRIGVIGFSAGGFLAANVAYNFIPEARPNFVAPIYSVIPKGKELIVRPDAPPLFIAAATDDSLAAVTNSIHLYTDWINARKPAELHLYAKGGHGLRTMPASDWIYRFEEWLYGQGFLHRTK